MRPSADIAINDHQQVMKYNALNTYTLYLRDTDRIGYIAGDAAHGTHNSFRLQLPEIPSGHIKNAMVRLKFLGMPITPDGSDAYGFGFVKTNFLKNCYSSSIGFNNQILGGFKVDEVCVVDETDVPALSTAFKRLAAGGAGAPAVLEDITADNRGALMDGAVPPAVNVQHQIDRTYMTGLPEITQATYKSPSKTLVCAKVGEPLSDNWIYCDNPFGKSLTFDIVGEDLTTHLDLGNAADESTCICLEVKLLPDNQANDRFSY